MTLALIAFVPYIRGILRGETKPHVFSWLIWSVTTSVVFFAQLDANGGIGTWPVGLSGAITGVIAAIAFAKHTDISITISDWVFFIAALSSLPFWYLTDNPLWAVVVLTAVDLLAFGPTFRKAYRFPYEENLTFFLTCMARDFCVLIALEEYSVATVLFPVSLIASCCVFSAMVAYRRRVIGLLER